MILRGLIAGGAPGLVVGDEPVQFPSEFLATDELRATLRDGLQDFLCTSDVVLVLKPLDLFFGELINFFPLMATLTKQHTRIFGSRAEKFT